MVSNKIKRLSYSLFYKTSSMFNYLLALRLGIIRVHNYDKNKNICIKKTAVGKVRSKVGVLRGYLRSKEPTEVCKNA